MMSTLSAQQLEAFHRDGYAVVKQLVPLRSIEGFLEECERAIDRQAQDLFARGFISNLHADLDVQRRAARIFRESPAIIDKVRGGRHAGPALFELLTSPPLLDVMEQLLGPELWSLGLYRLRPKVPRETSERSGALPWHQDANAYQLAADGLPIVTAWIALVDITPEMGALEVMPGSHRAGRLYRHYWVERLDLTAVHPDELPAGDAVPLAVSAGDVILFTSLTCHRSSHNLTDRIRWSLDARYHAPIASEIWPGEGGFLARSRARPEEVLRSGEEFVRLRQSATFDAKKQQRTWKREAEETFIRPPW